MTDKMEIVQVQSPPPEAPPRQENVELLRCLYHLDLFRRSVRRIRKPQLNCVRELFNSLTLVMSDYSENNINPIVINNMINQHLVNVHWSALREDLIYESICKEMNSEELVEISPFPSSQQIQPLLRYNLTKVCTTCGTSTTMNACPKNQYIISMEPIEIETATFEEQIIASLDSTEFCEKSNCFGHQRTHRTLTNLPNIFTFDYKQTSTKVFNLHEFLTPSLIFQTHQDSIYKVTAIILSPASSLVYHSRLNIWLFINNSIIKPLCSNFNNLKYNFNNYTVQLAFYTLEPIMSLENYNYTDNVIYENWQTTQTQNMLLLPPHPQNGILTKIPNRLTMELPDLDVETETEYYDSGISSYNSSIETHDIQSNPMSNSGQDRSRTPSLNNYATIKRNRSKCKNIMKSISVPNLAVPPVELVKRKVSFNCDIELIDLNEEYNPHPILMKILERMKI